VGRSLHELRETVPKDWLWVVDEIKALLDALPPEGSVVCMNYGNRSQKDEREDVSDYLPSASCVTC